MARHVRLSLSCALLVVLASSVAPTGARVLLAGGLVPRVSDACDPADDAPQTARDITALIPALGAPRAERHVTGAAGRWAARTRSAAPACSRTS